MPSADRSCRVFSARDRRNASSIHLITQSMKGIVTGITQNRTQYNHPDTSLTQFHGNYLFTLHFGNQVHLRLTTFIVIIINIANDVTAELALQGSLLPSI